MSFAKRFRSGAVAAAALLAVLLLSSSMIVAAEVVTSSVTNTSVTYDGWSYDFSQLTKYIYVSVSGSTVQGNGLTLQGKATGASSSDVGLSYLFTAGTITAPVTFSNSIVPNSVFLFTSSAVSASASTSSMSAFVFTTGTFVSNTTFTFSELTGTWPASAAGSSLVSAKNSFAVTGKSAIFVEQCKLTNVQNVLSIAPGATYAASVTDGSVVAVDDVTCTSCSGAVAQVTMALTVSQSSLFRISGIDAGAQALLSASGSVAVQSGSLMSVADSVSTGALFSFGGSTFVLTNNSALSLVNLTGGSTGIASGSTIPTTTDSGCYVYGDSHCTFGGVAMTSAETFASNGLTVNGFVGATDCKAAECVPGLATGLNTTDGACACLCPTGTYQPSCTLMSDPTGATTSASGSCSLYKCKTCSSTNLGVCTACVDDYTLDSATGTCSRTCNDANCATCGDDGVCTACKTHYTLLNDKTCLSCAIDNCATCSSADVCSVCVSGYSLYQNTCVKCGITNCATCTSNSVCGTCETGYSLSTDGKTCVSCNVDNCAHCTTANVCDTCKDATPPYTLTAAGTCVECKVGNCKTCATANVCSECVSSSYTLSGGKCILCNVDRCEACVSENKCGTCKATYSVGVAGQCYTCPPECALCSADNVCSTCPANYTLVGKTCVQCSVDYCLACSATNNCTSCSEGRAPNSEGECPLVVACKDGYYKATDGTCKPNCNIAYCTSCSAPGVCSACQGNLKLSSDKKSCTCATDACASCNAVRCVECLSGYKLTSGYLCVRITNAAASPLGLLAALLSFLVAALAVVSL